MYIKRQTPASIDRPIFLVGIGRCGSSIIYDVLARHPDLAWFSNYDGRFPRSRITPFIPRIDSVPKAAALILGAKVEHDVRKPKWHHLRPRPDGIVIPFSPRTSRVSEITFAALGHGSKLSKGEAKSSRHHALATTLGFHELSSTAHIFFNQLTPNEDQERMLNELQRIWDAVDRGGEQIGEDL